MTWIMDRIVRGEPQLGDSVLTDRAVAAQKLSQARIGFGGHTDNHASGEASGCGAIDKTPQILQAAQTFQDEIESTLRVVLGNHFEQAVYDKVLALFGSLSENSDYLADAQGSKTSRLLEDSNAVLKELHGSHNEAFVILNYVPGTTFNQAALNALTNDVIQAFAVDAWRIDAYSDIVSRWHNAVTDSYKTALHAGFMYTIAAASVLTDGTQEIFVRKPRNMLTPGV